MDIDHEEEEDKESILSVSFDFITSTALMNAPLKITANISTSNSTVVFDKISAEHLGYVHIESIDGRSKFIISSCYPEMN